MLKNKLVWHCWNFFSSIYCWKFVKIAAQSKYKSHECTGIHIYVARFKSSWVKLKMGLCCSLFSFKTLDLYQCQSQLDIFSQNIYKLFPHNWFFRIEILNILKKVNITVNLLCRLFCQLVIKALSLWTISTARNIVLVTGKYPTELQKYSLERHQASAHFYYRWSFSILPREFISLF